MDNRPPGLTLTPDALRREHADALEHWLASPGIPWERAVEGRRVAQYGCRYDYEAQGVDLTPCAPIPEVLRKVSSHVFIAKLCGRVFVGEDHVVSFFL